MALGVFSFLFKQRHLLDSDWKREAAYSVFER